MPGPPPLILRCVVADDEPFAREGMRQLIGQVPFLVLTASTGDALRVPDLIGDADLLFLDIEMPGFSGIALAQRLNKDIPIVFTTAFPEYAIKGYELNVLDYLLKPVTLQRFLMTANKAKALYEKQECLAVRTDKGLERIHLKDIRYIEARLNYVLIHLERRKIITYGSIKSMVERLPGPDFVKVHKSYIVALNKIEKLEGAGLVVGDARIPVSRENRARVQQWIASSGSL